MTPFWAAGLARHVIAVEPDPACLEILQSLAPDHANLTLLGGALSAEPLVTLTAMGSFGSSETTILALGDGARETVRGWTAAAILACAEPGPIFLKIDIEGYEYIAQPEIAQFMSKDLTGAQIALHPALFAQTLPGPKLWRHLRAAIETWHLARIFIPQLGRCTIHKHRSLLAYLWFGILLAPTPQGTDLIFERKAP